MGSKIIWFALNRFNLLFDNHCISIPNTQEDASFVGKMLQLSSPVWPAFPLVSCKGWFCTHFTNLAFVSLSTQTLHETFDYMLANVTDIMHNRYSFVHRP